MPRRFLFPARLCRFGVLLLVLRVMGSVGDGWAADSVAALPPGVRAEWDLAKARHETTATRERISLNGLWQWQPRTDPATPGTAVTAEDLVPASGWGHFKVPGAWPGITDYMQKDCQTVFPHPDWARASPARTSTAWYRRTITVPATWAERRIVLAVDTLNSLARVSLDGRPLGDLRFPGGELELPSAVLAPGTHELVLRVEALPLKAVLESYSDSAHAREVKGSVPRRGLCGDVWLVAGARGPRVTDVQVTPSVRERRVTCRVATEGLDPAKTYHLRARYTDLQAPGSERTFEGPPFHSGDPAALPVTLTSAWFPEHLWDTDTPAHRCRVELTLLDDSGHALDVAWPVTFGFREFWIEGRDFVLNGTPMHLSAVPLDNAQVGAAWASYEGARESLRRLQSFGINFVYTHNYGCEPGAHLAFDQVLRAADDVGMLVAFSQPHFSHYEWAGADADRTNGYARHAAHYVRVAQDHPSVVLYAMSHNATGYNEDMDPDLTDGIHDARDNWAAKNVVLAKRAEAIVRRLDPGRLVYHHASGNLGILHASNFYPNFAPIQELSDWFEHWAAVGVKPLFTCEYGAPFTWDWTMYRGWYRGEREFGSARVPWEFCLAEWNAQFLGDRAYAISDAEKANLRWEAAQYRRGALWHRWDYPVEVGSPRLTERYPVFARYLTHNWRAFRSWGVSATSPWEYGHLWTLRDGVDRSRRELPVDWENLQQPGFSPDYLAERYERMDLAYEASDWVPTPAAEALLRHNRPLLACLGGGARFTSPSHQACPGEVVERQVLLVNDSRHEVCVAAGWRLALPTVLAGTGEAVVPPGGQVRIPLRFELPADLPPGSYPLELQARFAGATQETQQDRLAVDVVAAPRTKPVPGRVAIFDPPGETAAALTHWGVTARVVGPDADLADVDLLVVGRRALTVDGPAPDLSRVREGLRVVVFEQTSEVLERRLGFRVVEYGLRDVHVRVPDHPVLEGLGPGPFHDWNGAATLLPPRLKPVMRPRQGPTVEWCGLSVPRVWRCGNEGNVASVLIEKPARGDFLPVLEGGFGLQYSPLLEYREGRGLVVFCQLDVIGRTVRDPVAETLARRLLAHAARWQPSSRPVAVFAGDDRARPWLEARGIPASPWTDPAPSDRALLVLAGGEAPAGPALGDRVAAFLRGGGRVLALGLGTNALSAVVPAGVSVRTTEHIATWFPPEPGASPLAGIGPAGLRNRAPRVLPVVAAGARRVGDGVLATAMGMATADGGGSWVACGFVPWQFEDPATGAGDRGATNASPANLRRTRRRAEFTVNRLLANLGVTSAVPLLERFHRPWAAAVSPAPGSTEPPRWRDGFYSDLPEEWDDPYRFFRW